jgi:ribonuclease HII
MASGEGASQVRRGRRPVVHRGEELSCSWRFEDEAAAKGCGVVAGLDEVGRGALCGPVVACAVVLGREFDASGLDDSKRLTPRQRERLAERVRAGARAWAIGESGPEEIDRVNILRATWRAMGRALSGLDVVPGLVLVDGVPAEGLGLPQRAIVKGDALSFSIAAASIVAKVARDAMMRKWDERCPGYGLARNMGYASGGHREALRRMGPSVIHRKSFQGTERWLF